MALKGQQESWIFDRFRAATSYCSISAGTSNKIMETQPQELKRTLPLSLRRFHISEEYGFLLPEPLKELPDYYKPWMEIANKLSHLIENHQLHVHVSKMPLLNCHFLESYREQRLAHLVLSSITMGYVWQEGETQPEQILPRNLALPFVEVSRNLGLPPILVHSDLVLANWTKRDPDGFLEIRNLDTIISFPGGESLHGFILVTALVEKAAVPGIKALVQAVNAILQPNQDSLLQALQQLRLSLQDITKTLEQMHGTVFSALSLKVPQKLRPVLGAGVGNKGLGIGQ
ncbi:PREDICTED: indoleamine 2,3-dioxygenase 2 [Elephantulus edwardii]|uniref:indoleamine 2,3-dioxygenase 2 n=1 Tax=Elephantulus edwardii TaxID=28737 RepID=UPI0003F06574|nr:PREDICTED: indoleamine 2,3-dioxygenase 2 [Elephantulus edwardii]